MNASSNSPWTPDPQLLAAYFDGELECRDDVADVRAKIEAWIETHPEAQEEWRKHLDLQQAWLDTAPADPGPATWNRVLEQIRAKRQVGEPGAQATGRRRVWLALGAFAASVALFVGLLFAAMRGLETTPKNGIAVNPNEPEPEIEVLQVATADEIRIIWIDGADTSAMIVGTMPLDEPMELVATSEFRVVTCCPKMNVRQSEHERPMVHARAD